MRPLLSLHGITAGYRRGAVLAGLDIEVPAGSALCVLGRNGVGKTTLLKTIIGILPAKKGRLEFGGEDMTTAPPYARARRGMGYLPQGRMVFPHLTVKENLLIGMEAAGHSDQAAYEEVVTLFPVLREMARRLAGTLSGGQQQLAIGRALVSQPRLLLLDEPTEGIQPSIVQEILLALQQVRRERQVTILLAEQFLDVAAALADHYYILDGGSVALSGPAEQISRAKIEEFLSV
ncbi:MAG: urea ABC transporter ATP-binding subunit UrtE [Chloroflexota bacterium]